MHEITERQRRFYDVGVLKLLSSWWVAKPCDVMQESKVSKACQIDCHGITIEWDDGSMQTRPDLVSRGEARCARHIESGHLIGEREPKTMPCHERTDFEFCSSYPSLNGPGIVDGGGLQMLILRETSVSGLMTSRHCQET